MRVPRAMGSAPMMLMLRPARWPAAGRFSCAVCVLFPGPLGNARGAVGMAGANGQRIMKTSPSPFPPAPLPDPARFALFLNVFVRNPAPASSRRVIRNG